MPLPVNCRNRSMTPEKWTSLAVMDSCLSRRRALASSDQEISVSVSFSSHSAVTSLERGCSRCAHKSLIGALASPNPDIPPGRRLRSNTANGRRLFFIQGAARQPAAYEVIDSRFVLAAGTYCAIIRAWRAPCPSRRGNRAARRKDRTVPPRHIG